MSSLSCLSATFVHCGQTVRWIKMKLGVQVGLGPGHIVFDGDPAPPKKKGAQPPIFGPCLLWHGWVHQDAAWYGGSPRSRPHYVRWGSNSPERGTAAPSFRPMSIVAKRSPISATAELLFPLIKAKAATSFKKISRQILTNRVVLTNNCIHRTTHITTSSIRQLRAAEVTTEVYTWLQTQYNVTYWRSMHVILTSIIVFYWTGVYTMH